MRVARCRAGSRPVLLGVILALSLGSVGCLDFEKQTLVAVFPKDRDEVRVLLVYEGLHAAGDRAEDLAKAKEHLDQLLQDNKCFYLGEPILRVDLLPDPKAKFSPAEVKLFDLARKHISTKAGVFNLSKDGKLALTQAVTIKDASKFIAGVNGWLSGEFQRTAENGSNGKGKDRFWDEESLKRVLAAAKKGHDWLRLEDGRLSLHLPVTPHVAANIKRDVMGLDRLARLQRFLDEIENPKNKDPKFSPVKELRRRLADEANIARALAEAPLSLDQRPDGLTVALGLGQRTPIELTLSHQPAHEVQVKEVIDHARKQSVPFRNDVTVADLIAEFHKTPR